MARPKKEQRFDASSTKIVEFFERRMRLREDQKDLSTMISSLNQAARAAGVDDGLISWLIRVAELPDGKRGWKIALARFYLDTLEELIGDKQVDIAEIIRNAKAREMESIAQTAPAAPVTPPDHAKKASAQAKAPPAAKKANGGSVAKGDAAGALAAAKAHLGGSDAAPLPA